MLRASQGREPDLQALYAQRSRLLAERRRQRADMQVQPKCRQCSEASGLLT